MVSTTPADTPPRRRVAVVGGGISGLTAAWNLTKAGYEVDIYDSASRLGGKIRTTALSDGQGIADHGGEFIDSDQKHIIEMCDELKVPLIEANETTSSRYRMPNGSVISDEQFIQAYRPISEQVYKDKLAIAADPTGARAKHLDGLSVTQYLQELNAKVPDSRPGWKRALLFWQKKPGVNPDTLTMAAQAYAAESMRPASQISALQFMHETACPTGDLIPSDCRYRVEGGTERVIDALKKELAAKGAHIHLNSKVTELTKNGNSFSMEIEGQDTAQDFDQVVLGAQAHHVASIKGMDKFMPPEDLETLKNLQGTAGSKFTIRTRVPVKNDGFFISSAGYESWKRAPGEMVFMIGDDLSAKHKPKELVKMALEDYASAHGTTVAKMFDTSKIDFHGPDAQNYCYWSVAQNQYLALRNVAKTADGLAKQGLGIVGTYLPGEMQTANGADSANCMGHGVESAHRAVACMTGMERARAQEMARMQEQEMPSSPHEAPTHAGNTAPLPTRPGGGRRTTATRV